ncbi:hypothetical protein ABTF71_19835, partial [Acinetobacter baumannii]
WLICTCKAAVGRLTRTVVGPGAGSAASAPDRLPARQVANAVEVIRRREVMAAVRLGQVLGPRTIALKDRPVNKYIA